MKKFYISLLFVVLSLTANAQGWPANYGGVMLQGFYWDGYTDARWTNLQKQTDNFKGYFDLVWLPQSGNCNGTSMGYDDFYWFPGGNHYESSFGSESQLRSLINTFKANQIGTIADVVINHRRNVSTWLDFPSETYNGVTYSMSSTDICGNDDGGNTKKNNPSASFGANDTGEDWGGMRDLDHTSSNVQTVCKAYTKMLIDDFGYAGFRYDMVKGYSASYTAMYNNNAKPTYSVGECWDGTGTICNWINGTKLNGSGEPLSAAFDFQFKYVCKNAFNGGDMTKLNQQNDGNWPLVHSTTKSSYSSQFDTYRYAVTFVENHDTEKRPDGSSNGPLEKDTLAANAWLLANPGTPCVFYKHYLAYPAEIKAMIDVRKAAGITNQSTYTNFSTNANYFARAIKVNNANKLMVIVGKNTSGYTPAANTWKEVLNGYHYKMFLAKTLEIPFADKPSGTYSESFKVKLVAVSATDGAQLVYTTNGSTPTASNGTKVATGSEITISSDCTLKVGLLKSNAVSGVITREYKFEQAVEWSLPTIATFVPDKLFAYFENTPEWGTVNVWVWNTSNVSLYSSWPGSSADVTLVGTNPSTGYEVYRWEHEPTSTITNDNIKGIIFNNGSSQTKDLTWANGAYYYLTSLSTETNYKAVITGSTGINDITVDQDRFNGKVYSLDGREVKGLSENGSLSRGIYVKNGKKFIVK